MNLDINKYWNYLCQLKGNWEGKVSGEPGTGKGNCSYDFFQGKKFLISKTKSVFPPQEQNIDGEVHEDIGFFSYDKNTETGHFRVFYSEGYVSDYILIDYQEENQVMVFEAIIHENLPEGFKAKIMFQLKDLTTLEEKFELAPSGNYNVCIINKWHKV